MKDRMHSSCFSYYSHYSEADASPASAKWSVLPRWPSTLTVYSLSISFPSRSPIRRCCHSIENSREVDLFFFSSGTVVDIDSSSVKLLYTKGLHLLWRRSATKDETTTATWRVCSRRDRNRRLLFRRWQSAFFQIHHSMQRAIIRTRWRAEFELVSFILFCEGFSAEISLPVCSSVQKTLYASNGGDFFFCKVSIVYSLTAGWNSHA